MYCRECGEKLTLRFCENEGLIPYCAKCESFMFPQFPIAVSMVVTNRAQDKILLAKHVEDEDFILIAGYIKQGENAEKTIPREIKEELGMDVVKAKYMSSRYHSKKELLMLNFIVIVEDTPIKLKEDEVAEARWCSPEEAVQKHDGGILLKQRHTRTQTENLKNVRRLGKKPIRFFKIFFLPSQFFFPVTLTFNGFFGTIV